MGLSLRTPRRPTQNDKVKARTRDLREGFVEELKALANATNRKPEVTEVVENNVKRTTLERGGARCSNGEATANDRAAQSEQDLHQGLAMGIRQRRPRTRRRTCLMRTSTGRSRRKVPFSNIRLHETRRPVHQCRRVCVERCPLTMRHEATRRGESCGSESTRTRPHGSVAAPSFGGMHTQTPWQEAMTQKLRPDLLGSLRLRGPRCTIAASRWPSRGVDEGNGDVASKPRRSPHLSNARSTLSRAWHV